MSDNVELNPQSGGAVVGADEVTDDTLGTVKVQYVKLMDGALDGTAKSAIDANGLDVDVTRVGGTVTIGPVAGTVTVQDGGGAITVDGTVAATQSGTWNIGAITTLPAIAGTVAVSSLPAVSGTVTATPSGTQTVTGTVAATQSGSWTVTSNVGTGTRPISGTVGVSSGTVTISNASIPVTDNGGSLTVDGTVAATQSGTWNIGSITTLPAISGTVTSVAGTGTRTVAGTVSVSTLPAVSGTVTVSSITSALPAGTNAIGKLSANSGVDIGDVDVLSIVPGTGATNLGKAEDALHASGDVGVMALGVRNDNAATARSGANADYTPLAVNAAGEVFVVHRSGATLANGAGTVTTSTAQVLAASTTRRSVLITNLGTATIWVGASGVAANSGARLKPDESLVIDKAATAAIHAVATSGSSPIAFLTEAD